MSLTGQFNLHQNLTEFYEQYAARAWHNYLNNGRGLLLVEPLNLNDPNSTVNVRYIPESEPWDERLYGVRAAATQFLVKQYDPEKEFVVALVSGEVMKHGNAELTPPKAYKRKLTSLR